ncbi:hypothetical protein [Mycobacteroides abscessus]|uniref:hypothetical protein n=1 Tax=Mycobacteroides abscessus TaxID=36809 RepID=UPI0012FFD7FC
MNLNPSLNQKKKSQTTARPSTPSAPRKPRIDKKHDIKIPLSYEIEYLIRTKSRARGKSKTAYSTELLEQALTRSYVFPEVPYEDSDISTHAKVSKETYLIIGNYADKWGHGSVRKAAHRILMEMIRIETGGVIIEKV